MVHAIVGSSPGWHHFMSNSYDLGSMFTISMETCAAGHLIPEASLCPDWFLSSGQLLRIWLWERMAICCQLTRKHLVYKPYLWLEMYCWSCTHLCLLAALIITAVKIAHWCIFDADNPSRIPFVVRPDIPNIRQSAENSILLSWASKCLPLHWFFESGVGEQLP
jgi:hypothetical protein